MKNSKNIKVILIILCITLVVILFLYTRRIIENKPVEIKSPPKKENSTDVRNISIQDEAPDLKNKGQWINTANGITAEDLKGKVVLLEFWTFGCYNCVNTLPYLEKWYDKYKSENFEMIGVHCPEFDNERVFENVKENVKELGIKYPVITDNEFSIWNKYDVHAWPSIFLIDKKGEIRYKKVGEGSYDKTEETIAELLKEDYP